MRTPDPLPADRRRHYSFAGFTLDMDRRVLRRGREEVTLRAKSMDVLAYLVNHRDQVVYQGRAYGSGLV